MMPVHNISRRAHNFSQNWPKSAWNTKVKMIKGFGKKTLVGYYLFSSQGIPFVYVDKDNKILFSFIERKIIWMTTCK